MNKRKVAVIGATGVLGQQCVEVLDKHPWFEISVLSASERSAGKSYFDAIKDRKYIDLDKISEDNLEKKVVDVSKINPKKLDAEIVFSALPAENAKEIDPKFAKYKHVFSTSSAFRYEPDVPILIPEVNPEQIELMKAQEKRGWKGSMSAISNCTTAGLVISLKPIHEKFGVKTLFMTSLQALSGAGEKGVREDSEYRKIMEKNVIPFIEKEEEKVQKEVKKIFGTCEKGRIVDSSIDIYCTCTRVFVEDGHTEAVFVETEKECSADEVKNLLKNFVGEPQKLKLPSAPAKPIIVFDDPIPEKYETYKPQPRFDVEKFGGMVTFVGRIRKIKDKIGYILLSHNTKKGGAKGAVFNAEFLVAKKFI
jgi:aspartate-semialdehyde dehydrogenase